MPLQSKCQFVDRVSIVCFPRAGATPAIAASFVAAPRAVRLWGHITPGLHFGPHRIDLSWRISGAGRMHGCK